MDEATCKECCRGGAHNSSDYNRCNFLFNQDNDADDGAPDDDEDWHGGGEGDGDAREQEQEGGNEHGNLSTKP